jgi:hypothetical protein
MGGPDHRQALPDRPTVTVDVAQLLRDLLERDGDHYEVRGTCGPCGGEWPCTGERVRQAVAELPT